MQRSIRIAVFVLVVMPAPLVGCSADASGGRQQGPPRGVLGTGSSPSAGVGAASAAGSDGSAFGNAVPTSTGPGSAGNGAEPPPALVATGECGAVVQMAENTLQPVDIIVGIDTTGSMGEEIAFTEQHMNAFSQQIVDAGIDVRVILIAGQKDGMPAFPHLDGVCIGAPLGSGSCPGDSKPARYVHIAQPLTDWDMLEYYVDAYPRYREHLREDSFKTFVSISDGDIAGNQLLQHPINSADTFIAAIEALEPGSPMWRSWRYSAIYAFSPCGIGNTVGMVHADLVERTQGVAGDLCLQDFAPVFDDLAKQVVSVATLACDWEIPPVPDGQTFDPGKTNVRLTLDGTTEQLGKARTEEDCDVRDAWRYDDEDAPRRVVACPSTCTRIQAALDARVDLLFGCETFILPPE